MIEPDDGIVCMNVAAGPPRVPSFVDVCSRCGEAVWRSNRSAGFAGIIVCMVCFLDDLPEGGVKIEPAPWVRRDLLGHD